MHTTTIRITPASAQCWTVPEVEERYYVEHRSAHARRSHRSAPDRQVISPELVTHLPRAWPEAPECPGLHVAGRGRGPGDRHRQRLDRRLELPPIGVGSGRSASWSRLPAVAGPRLAHQPCGDDDHGGVSQPERHHGGPPFGTPHKLLVRVGPGVRPLHDPALLPSAGLASLARQSGPSARGRPSAGG